MRAFVIAVAVLTAAAGAAQAETLSFHATLNGASEVPPNTTTGTGMAMATLDTNTKVLKYTVTYQGLTGPATAAHFHGPAGPGANAPPSVMLMNVQTSPITAQATLTDAQIADLRAGKWYVNVHTMAHPGGEIRGQVTAAP
jgi:hypothetical protein